LAKILVIGFGSIGKRHVENLLNNTKHEIIILTKRQNLNLLKKKRIKIYDTLEACPSQQPKIGFITNETAYHIPIAIKLAKAGLDLFIEKPLSDSMKGIITLQSIVKQKKLIVLMGCQLRFHPCIKKINQLLKQQKIGKIISIQVENGSYLPDWHPYEDYRISYAGKKNLGGGVVLTMIHDIDYLYWIFGIPRSIFSITGKFSNLEISSEDYSCSLLQFKKNIIAELHLDFFQGPNYRRFKIKGTNGIILWDSDNNEVKCYNNKKMKWENYMKLKFFDINKTYVDEVRHFFKCIKNREKTINDLHDGIETMKIALDIKKSAKLEKRIRMKQ